MIYINLEKEYFENYDNDQFIAKLAQTPQEAMQLVEIGFTYVSGNFNDGGQIFRKRK